MAYIYPISTEAMFEDRTEQFVTQGVPRADVEAMRAAISDMWADAPGGWVYEWSALARRYADRGEPYLASLAYGCAKFPCLANEARRTALARQLEAYLAAAPSFPVRFERQLIEAPFRGASITVPVHIFANHDRFDAAPVLLISGGVDTWKMDTHGICIALAKGLGLTVVAFDQPGAGEMPAPLTPEADETVLGLVEAARRIGSGPIAHLGISFGGAYSAMTGLMGAVDAAIVLGGPIDKAFDAEALARLPFGMPDIIGNDMGFDHKPEPAEFTRAARALAHGALLARTDNAPMLVINGADDYFIPQADTLVFQGRPNTEVHLIEGTGHCAFSKLPEVMALVAKWLPAQLTAAVAGKTQAARA